MSRILTLLVCSALLAGAPSNARAQARAERAELYLGANMLAGGVSALVQALAAEDPKDPLQAFVTGALGGSITFVGQTMVGTGDPRLRLVGVQTAAVGANIVRNAGAGVPVLSDLTLPIFPFYLRLRSEEPTPVSARLSAIGLYGLAYGVLGSDRHQLEFDLGESLLAAGPVFRSSSSYLYPDHGPAEPSCLHGDGCEGSAAGLNVFGTVVYTTGGRTRAASRQIIAHEVVHSTQFHRDAIRYGLPVSEAVLERAGGPFRFLSRFVVLDLALPLTAANELSAGVLPLTAGGQRAGLYEREARALAGPRGAL